MKKRFSKIIIGLVLSAGMLVTSVPVYAAKDTKKTSTSSSEATTQSTLADLQNKVSVTQQAIDSLTSQKQENAENRSELITQQQDLQAQYNSIKAQADAVNTQMAVAESNITALNDAMESLSMELDGLETEEEQRYSDMKKRIQYFYENHYGENALTIICESNSIHEAMDSFQSVSRIMEYDRNCLDELQQTQEDIKEKQKEIEAKHDDIVAFQESLNASVSQMNALRDAAADALDSKNSEIAALNANDAQYSQEINNLQSRMTTYQAQEAQAQMKAAQQVSIQIAQNTSGGTEYTGGAISTGTDEVMLLAATIQGEAWNQPYEGKLAVASVIANRVKSKYFPNTITGVITAPRQFEAYSCGLVNKYLQAGVDATCLEIARKVVAGTRNGNWLFFMTKPWADHFGITGYQLIGAHAFFRVWGNNSGQNFSADIDNTPINTTTVDSPASNTGSNTTAGNTNASSTTTNNTANPTPSTSTDTGNNTNTSDSNAGTTTTDPGTTPADTSGASGQTGTTPSSDADTGTTTDPTGDTTGTDSSGTSQ